MSPMSEQRQDVLKFRVELNGIQPLIWREILVPAHYSLWDLHVAVQDAMGWLDCHLHEFRFRGPDRAEDTEETLVGIPSDEEWDDMPEVLPGWDIPAVTYFTKPGDKAGYLYDFGDDWQHELVLLAVEPGQGEVQYPLCVAGERAGPPEDCGGTHGYARMLESLFNPKDPEHRVMVRWIPENWGPELFNAEKVHFDDPQKRWDQACLLDD